MPRDQEFQHILSTADMFQFLSLSLHLPSMEFINGLLDGTVAKDIVDILKELDYPDEAIENLEGRLRYIQDNTAEALFHETRQEYTRLFSHPDKPVIGIYETTFLKMENNGVASSMFISPASLSAERHYKIEGLLPRGDFREPSDFFPTQLEFLMFLYQRLAVAIEENNDTDAEALETSIKEFTEAHLSNWATDFFSACLTQSDNPVFNMIGTLGTSFFSHSLTVQ